MAQFGKNLQDAHPWTPPWWGNERLPRAEQFVLLLRPVTMGESRSLALGEIEDAEKAKAVIDVVAERIVEIRGLADEDGKPITDPVALVDRLSPAQFQELSTVVFRGLTDAEGKG